ncbi:MAG: rhodanese-like domain-containing protein [bacterium]
MKIQHFLTIIAVVAGAGLLVVKQPTVNSKLAKAEPKLEAQIETRKFQIDPGELFEIANGDAMQLRIYDVRNESDYNIFHIVDSERISESQLKDPKWVSNLPEQTIKVFVSNDERAATKAWKLLAAQNVQNIYILGGGINKWISAYGEPSAARRIKAGDDKLKYSFPFALGKAQPGADPDPHRVAPRKFIKKVKPVGPTVRKSGGCG